MRNIKYFKNYRDFLKEYYYEKKEEKKGFTIREFSKNFGMNSPNYMKLIMDGERDLTILNIHKISKVLKFVPSEIEYFETLVLMNQSKSSLEKNYYSMRLRGLEALDSDGSLKGFTSRKKSSLLLSKADYLLALILASRKSFDKALEKILQETHGQKDEVKMILNNLIKEGYLKVDTEGLLQIEHQHQMFFDTNKMNQSQKIFLEEGLKESLKVFQVRYLTGVSKFLSVLMTAPEGSVEEMFNEMREAVEQITKKYTPQNHQTEGVYRIQAQVYRIKQDKA